MAFEMEINGVNVDKHWIRNSLTITEQTQADGQTLNVVLQINDRAIDTPEGGQHVQFTRDGIVEFAGRISTVLEYQEQLPNQLKYEISCIDYTADLDSKLINQDFESNNAGAIISTIIGQIGLGFTSNNTILGPVVTSQEIRLEHPSAVISRMAESVEHQWYVDYHRDLNFFYILDRPAPVEEIDLDSDIANHFDPTIEEHWEQVKNVLYLQGAKVRSGGGSGGGGSGGDGLQDQIIHKGDGDQRFFPLNYEPWSVDTTSVTVDGVPQEILLDTNAGQAGDGRGEKGQCFLCIDNWGIRFPDDHPPGGDLPEGSEDLPVDVGGSHDYAYEPIIKVEDPASIQQMREREDYIDAPSDGIHEFKFDIPDLRVDNEAAIWDYGNILLQRYAYPYYTFSFGSYTQGWSPGQSFRAIATQYRSFDRTVYVQSVTKNILKNSDDLSLFEYEIEASTNPFPA